MSLPLAPDLTTADILKWDVRTWSPVLDLWRGALGSPDRPLECLELGAGPGGPSLWLAAQGHNVVCSNFSSSRELATPLHSRYPEITSIQYQDVDMTDIPWESHFDVIVFRSVLGGVRPIGVESQQIAIEQIRRALKPGGVLLFAENTRATVFHRIARRLAHRRRTGPWSYPTNRDFAGYFERFASFQLRHTGVLAMFGLTESHRAALSRADAAVFNRLPRSWRYVTYGTATT